MRIVILLALSFSSIINGVIVNIPELGDVEGIITSSSWTNRTIHEFLGIRYGLPPSGSRRFMPTVPVTPWDGIYNATANKQSCPDISNMEELLSRPPDVDVEDCLTLNVFTPRLPPNNSDLIPVMVFIHGGGFAAGNAILYRPGFLLEHDVVLVVIQYRLGPLGFLSLDTDGIPGNAGLIDQVEALRWVNKYIKNFGGDNTQVTLFGESAGACSVAYHLLSPIVEPYLFQKAIIQSGSSYANWALDKNPLIVATSVYNTLTNTTITPDVSLMESTFKNISVVQLFIATLKNASPLLPNALISRGVIQKAGSVRYLTKSPVDYLATGEFRTIPTIAGVVKHEGTFLTLVLYDILELYNVQDNDDFLRNNLTDYCLRFLEIEENTGSLIDVLHNVLFKDIFNQPKSLTFADIAPGISDLLGVLAIKGQTLKQAKINSKYQPNNTYFYTFEHRGEHTVFGFGADTSKYPFDGGVSHADDLIYLFPYIFNFNSQDLEIAKLMTDLWTSFAINTKPTSSRMPVEWPTIQKNQNGPFLHINVSSYIGDDFVGTEYMAITNEQRV